MCCLRRPTPLREQATRSSSAPCSLELSAALYPFFTIPISYQHYLLCLEPRVASRESIRSRCTRGPHKRSTSDSRLTTSSANMADIMDEDPSSGLQSSEEEPEVPVESLISGRAKRSTAGRHMSALIDAAADDDLTLLFQEVDDDNEFAMEAEAAEEEDLGLDSSEDDDDDQGPNAQNDYEGEKELQKEERKKRKTQNDLRFQTLRKRVKIDPTVSSVPAAAPRPKKKSERISWLPTPEDGPTRSSSRRQTMVNKELTHARLKDSQEKRIRIIATMKEAEKRKAHLKPKEMTQEDHLAEAARVERLNSKSLNRWEQTEKRKAEERRAKIEALQNRRLEGPVISYWSGLATWTNGRLTRVGKVDIKVKPEKDEPKKKKKAEEKVTETQGLQATPGPSQSQQPQPPQQPQQPPSNAPAVVENTAALPVAEQPENPQPSDQKPAPPESNPEGTTPSVPVPAEPNKTNDQAPEQHTTPAPPAENEKLPDEGFSSPKDSRKYPVPVVEVSAPPRPHAPASKSPDQAETVPSAEKADAMDVGQKPPADTAKVESTQSATEQAKQPTATSADTQAVSRGDTSTGPRPPEASPQYVTPQPGPATTPLDSQTSTDPSAAAAPVHATPAENTSIQGHQPGSTIQATVQTQTQSHEPGGPSQPEQPPPPPVIEHTGRNLTILENFDDRTAHSKKYSMYFNAKKPPRLTSMLSSIV